MEDSFSKVSGPSACVFVFFFGIMDSQGHRFQLPAVRRDNQGVLASERLDDIHLDSKSTRYLLSLVFSNFLTLDLKDKRYFSSENTMI